MEEQLCKFNQEGFCKFGTKCNRRHDNEICINRNKCESPQCNKRHPKLCRFYYQFGQCKFGDNCAFSHSRENTRKEESLENEVKELKEDVNKLKEENRKVKTLKKEVEMLKDDMKKLKEEMMIKMDRILTLLGTDDEVECDASNKKETETSEKDEKVNDELKFKCDKCNYKAKRSITLKKHMNTKHRKTDQNGETEETKRETRKTDSKEKKKPRENCDNCVNCENCEYVANSSSCQLCMKLLEAAVEKYDF